MKIYLTLNNFNSNIHICIFYKNYQQCPIKILFCLHHSSHSRSVNNILPFFLPKFPDLGSRRFSSSRIEIPRREKGCITPVEWSRALYGKLESRVYTLVEVVTANEQGGTAPSSEVSSLAVFKKRVASQNAALVLGNVCFHALERREGREKSRVISREIFGAEVMPAQFQR